jgi:hypothetical protein
MGLLVLIFACIGVVPSPGWSNPVLVTDSANSTRRLQFINRDSQGRFHLVWEGYNGQTARIAYKMFDINGSTLYPETMISRNTVSAYLSEVVMGDSLFVFWREYNPIYYAIRSLTDGSEIVPATYLFTTSTMFPYIRACPDSLGRMHVLYNVGDDVYYAVWTPAPGSGFITDYEWKVEGADAGGVLLVDGNRVHLVVQDSLVHDYLYLQYDLEGNTTVPLTDFTDGSYECSRFPELCLDPYGNLMVIEDSWPAYLMWKVDKSNGATLVNAAYLVIECLPEMGLSTSRIVRQIPGEDKYYLTWCYSGPHDDHRVFNLVFDSDGNVLVDWHIAYNYDGEISEDLREIDGVTDDNGNLYIIYSQAETEPVLGGYPTFGWFDYDYVSIEQQQTAAVPGDGFSFSCNPVTGSVTVQTSSESQTLRVFDISGREVSSIVVSDGVGTWSGTGFSGERLSAGIYNIIGDSGVLQRITLLNQ